MNKLLRCPSQKKHGKYDTCGHTLGGISDGKLYFYCGACNRMWELTVLDGGVAFRKMDKKERLESNDLLQLIEE